MEFRWTVLMALWTLISGPIFAGSGPPASTRFPPRAAAAQHGKTFAAKPPAGPRAGRR
jgi:hypothetical protein